MTNGDLSNDIKAHFLSASMVPASADEVSRVASYANSIRDAFAKDIPNFGYNTGSVKFLSDSVDAERPTYSENDKIRVANLYGAFLGQTILKANAEANGRWVKYDGDLAILFERAGQKRLVFPINRLFKQIEEGNSASMYAFFLAIREFLQTNP